MPLYSREQYEADMAEIEAIRVKMRRKYVKSEMLQQEMRECHLNGHHNSPDATKCPFCVHAVEALKKLYVDPFKFKRIADQCDSLELAFTERLRATARLLTEKDRSGFIAINCAKLKHRCFNPKACGCSCHGRRRT